MNLLAIETATTSCAIGLQWGTRQEVRTLDVARRHTEVLTEGITSLLSDGGLRVDDLERVVVDRGPGLYTGLRVGLATAQALARGRGVDLVGVTSLELLAHGARRAGVRGRLLALVDARRGEIFAQTFEVGDDVIVVDQPCVTSATALAVLAATNGDQLTLTGDGAVRYDEIFRAVAHFEQFTQSLPSLLDALDLGAVRAPSDDVAPLYLREADAIANFSTRQRQP